MLASYVVRDLVRNPRRTLAALAGITLGVALFSGVLFFIDGSGASMTKRALAPLAIDMQRVTGASTGGRLELVERLEPAGGVAAGQPVAVRLTVTNRSRVPANEVVVNDVPPAQFTYVRGTSALNGRAVADPEQGTPLSRDLAMIGLNLGTLAPGNAAIVTYSARASAATDTRLVRLRGRISSREEPVPVGANAASELSIDQLAARVRALPAVAAADPLQFVDLPPGSLSSPAGATSDTVRVFGLSAQYARHHPSVGIIVGALTARGAALSVEASRALHVPPGGRVRLSLPGGRPPLELPVVALADLSRAKPLFYSRRASDLETFLYRPHTIIVDPATFAGQIIPAFQAAGAARGYRRATQPLQELDVQLDRSRLQADPGTALSQTRNVATAISQLSPGRSYLIDNASNALQVARDDAAVAKRMFLFLGLPGALLAAFLAAYAGGVLASAQRRDQALLRVRGAHQGHLLRMLAYRTVVLAGVGAAVGVVLGLLSVMIILGPGTLFESSVGQLAATALISVGIGMFTTAVALYPPGRRWLHREINEERSELELGAAPLWRRLRLDLLLLAAAAAGEIIALRRGAFDTPPGSVYEGRAVSLPSYLLLAPIGAWIAGVLLSVRVFDALAERAPVGPPPRFGPPVRGNLARSLRRRSWSLAGGVAGVGLVVAFGTSLVTFTASYDAGKAADARFTVGSDLRVTPGVLSNAPHPPSFASALRVPGVEAVAPVLFKPQNAVLTTSFNEDQKSLAAIDPSSFSRVAAPSDRFFVGGSGAAALAALARDPRGVLVNAATADDLKVAVGDHVRVLLARGTAHQVAIGARVLGLFRRMPGFPQGVDLIANLSRYDAATRTNAVDFFLARTSNPGASGLNAAVSALQRGPGAHDQLIVDTTLTALDKDQSSLTALNVRGLVDLDSFYTVMMGAASVSIFVFGLMLQRRREYITLRAQGLQTRELRALVLGETAVVTSFGLVAGVLVGVGMGHLLVRVLQPLFVLRRDATVSVTDTAMLVALVAAAALAAALAATELLRRLRPTELLRET